MRRQVRLVLPPCDKEAGPSTKMVCKGRSKQLLWLAITRNATRSENRKKQVAWFFRRTESVKPRRAISSFTTALTTASCATTLAVGAPPTASAGPTCTPTKDGHNADANGHRSQYIISMRQACYAAWQVALATGSVNCKQGHLDICLRQLFICSHNTQLVSGIYKRHVRQVRQVMEWCELVCSYLPDSGAIAYVMVASLCVAKGEAALAVIESTPVPRA